MFPTDAFLAAHKANTQALHALSSHAFDAFERFVGLNTQAVKAALDDSAAAAQSLLSVQDVSSLAVANASITQPAVQRAISYGRETYEIVVAFQTQAFQDTQAFVAESQRHGTEIVDRLLESAPLDPFGMFDLVKSFTPTVAVTEVPTTEAAGDVTKVRAMATRPRKTA